MAGLRWPRLPLRAYFALLVSLFVGAAAAGAVFVGVQSNRDARERALTDAAFAAEASAEQLGAFVTSLKKTTASLAANPGIAQVLVRPEGCSLTFSGIGGPDRGHIDIVRADGVVLCSSQKVPPGSVRAPYAGSAWMGRALERRIFVDVASDATTGAPVVISAAPIAGGKAVVAAFGDLAAVGPELAASYGGGRPSEFLVTGGDGATVIARSIEPQRWVGKSVAGTAFARAGAREEGRDLDGVSRFYASAAVPGLGWRFYVGEDRSTALAFEDRLKRRQLLIVLAGLMASLLVALLVYRRVVVPIRRLSGALRATSGEVRPVPVATGGPAEVRALAEDVNGLVASVNRELAERLESEARYRDLFENATDLIVVLDLDGRLVNANAAFVSALGSDRQELIGSSLPQLLPPEADAGAAPAGLDARRPVSVGAYERELVANDGRRIQVEVGSRLIEGERGPVGYEAICRDISERKLLEEQLRQAQRLESVGRLAGGVAHDFNNVLTVISGYTDMLLARGTSGGQTELRGIADASLRAANLTRQLLAFSRQQVLQPRVVNVNEVVSGVLPMLSRLIGEHIHVITKLAPAVHPVVADPTQLEQVLVNLVVNARDAMPDGGTIAIETGNTELDDAYLAQHPEAQLGANAVLTVSDTGTGMDAETLARAFEPFFSTKPVGSGTGLGLATVHGIVKQSGGSIWAYSELGIGTTFKVHLPMTTDAPSAVPDKDPGQTAAVGTETILVAEDEDMLRPLIALMLEHHGYTALTAGTALEAIEIIDREGMRIDLLLTDLVMPEMNGRELAQRIRRRREALPVLFMSGYAGDTATRSGALDLDAAFLEKPFSSADLARRVRETLDHSKQLVSLPPTDLR